MTRRCTTEDNLVILVTLKRIEATKSMKTHNIVSATAYSNDIHYQVASCPFVVVYTNFPDDRIFPEQQHGCTFIASQPR